MTYGDRVKAARLHAKLSVTELARKVGLGKTTLYDIERGDQESSSRTASIAHVTRVNGMWLEVGKGSMLDEIEGSPPATRPAGEIEIPELEVAGSMGDGTYPPDHIDVVKMVSVNVADLRRQCTFTAPENLQIITGSGRSMMGTFADGDPLLVDTGVNTVVEDGAVYAFTFEGRFYIKGLQLLPDRIRVISHNRDENDPWDISGDNVSSLTIHARVVLAWNARRL